MIEIDITDNGVREALARLAELGNKKTLHPALKSIGEILVDSTRQRFATSTAPDGTRWAPNSQVTILQYLRVKSGKYEGKQRVGTKDGFLYQKDDKHKRKGKLAAKGIEAVMGKRPLIGHTSDLSRQIYAEIEGNDTLYIVSTVPYAATQQFGAKRHQFEGKAPWGDIPARPFLGLSKSDRENILDIIEDFLNPD